MKILSLLLFALVTYNCNLGRSYTINENATNIINGHLISESDFETKPHIKLEIKSDFEIKQNIKTDVNDDEFDNPFNVIPATESSIDEKHDSEIALKHESDEYRISERNNMPYTEIITNAYDEETQILANLTRNDVIKYLTDESGKIDKRRFGFNQLKSSDFDEIAVEDDILNLKPLQTAAPEEEDADERTIRTTVYAVPGFDIYFDMAPSLLEGKGIMMLLCFKDGEEVPFFKKTYLNAENWKEAYSVDYRSGTETFYHMADSIGSRVNYHYSIKNPTKMALSIIGAMNEDAGIYRCRMDFVRHPSIDLIYHVKFVVPPLKPIFFQGSKIVERTVGPFKLGDSLHLSCSVVGGDPRPNITWRHGENILESIDDPLTERTLKTSHLIISNLTKYISTGTLECWASSSELIPPSVNEIKVIIYTAPTSVTLTAKPGLMAGQEMDIACETDGSFPAPQFSWFQNGRLLKKGGAKILYPDLATSVLVLNLTSNDNNNEVVCRVVNTRFPSQEFEVSKILNVNFAPEVQITFGDMNSTVSVGEPLTLTCESFSNPATYEYKWYKGNKQLLENEHIQINNDTLHIMYLDKSDSGIYACSATNKVGITMSPELFVQVLYPPTCADDYKDAISYAAIGHETNVSCMVTGPSLNITGPLEFDWTYKTTLKTRTIPRANINTTGQVSTVRIKPINSSKDEADLGTLFCSATNMYMQQQEPCAIRLIKADVPSPPRECKISNGTKWLNVTCIRGFNGGLKQHFVIVLLTDKKSVEDDLKQTRDIPTFGDTASDLNASTLLGDQDTTPHYEIILRKENDSPVFNIQGIEENKVIAVVYAENAQGRSSSVEMKAYLPWNTRNATDVLEENPGFMKSIVLGTMCLSVILTSGLYGFIALCCRRRIPCCKRNRTNETEQRRKARDEEIASTGPKAYSLESPVIEFKGIHSDTEKENVICTAINGGHIGGSIQLRTNCPSETSV